MAVVNDNMISGTSISSSCQSTVSYNIAILKNFTKFKRNTSDGDARYFLANVLKKSSISDVLLKILGNFS